MEDKVLHAGCPVCGRRICDIRSGSDIGLKCQKCGAELHITFRNDCLNIAVTERHCGK